MPLGQALGRTFDPGEHGQELIAQVMLDLEEVWSGPPVDLVLSGPAGATYRLGRGEPVATVQTDAVGYMRTVSGRDDHPVVELLSGDPACAEAVATTRMPSESPVCPSSKTTIARSARRAMIPS